MNAASMTFDLFIESYYKLAYALAVRNKLNDVVRKFCYGCEESLPNRENHTCSSTNDQLLVYFDIILKEVDEDKIFQSWLNIMNCNNNIPPDLILVQINKRTSKDYLSEMKTSAWKKEIKQLAHVLIQVEQCEKL